MRLPWDRSKAKSKCRRSISRNGRTGEGFVFPGVILALDPQGRILESYTGNEEKMVPTSFLEEASFRNSPVTWASLADPEPVLSSSWNSRPPVLPRPGCEPSRFRQKRGPDRLTAELRTGAIGSWPQSTLEKWAMTLEPRWVGRVSPLRAAIPRSAAECRPYRHPPACTTRPAWRKMSTASAVTVALGDTNRVEGRPWPSLSRFLSPVP